MAGEFKAHGDRLGPRLKQIEELGPPGVARRLVDDLDREVKPKAAGLKPGRPRVEGAKPWEAAGVSRSTWFRRKAGGS